MGATRALNERAQTLTGTAAAADKRAEGLESELEATRARLQANVDLASENSRVSRSLTEKDAALDDTRTRIKFLETALTAAEAECTRLAAEMSGARDKHGADSDALNGLLETMSSRAITADKLLAEARQRLHARTAENGAAEKDSPMQGPHTMKSTAKTGSSWMSSGCDNARSMNLNSRA